MNFEKSLIELESVVSKLEDSSVTLASGIVLFEKGLELTKSCVESLNDAKGKITALKQEMDKLTEEII